MPDFSKVEGAALFAFFAILLVREVGQWIRARGAGKREEKAQCQAAAAMVAHEQREDRLFSKIADAMEAQSELNRAQAQTLQSFVQSHQSWQMEVRSHMHEMGTGVAKLLDRRWPPKGTA